jgi:hypothetical protein
MSNGDNPNIIVGTWSLQDTTKSVQSAEIMLTTAGEVSLISDHRTVVATKDIKDGGQYRCEFAQPKLIYFRILTPTNL